MNKVKPQAGQVWQVKGSNESPCKICHVDKFGVVYWSESGDDWSDSEQMKHWEFIPQNDLEWLAVNDVKIPEGEKFAYYSNHIDRVVKFSQTIFKNGKTQDEIQNMRYKLGLDEKPRISAKEWARMLKSKSENNDYLNGVFN